MGVSSLFYPFNIIWPQNFFPFCHFPAEFAVSLGVDADDWIFSSRDNLPGAEYCGTMAKGKSHHGFCPSTHLPEQFSWLPYAGQLRYLITHSWSLWLTDWLTYSFIHKLTCTLTLTITPAARLDTLLGQEPNHGLRTRGITSVRWTTRVEK